MAMLEISADQSNDFLTFVFNSMTAIKVCTEKCNRFLWNYAAQNDKYCSLLTLRYNVVKYKDKILATAIFICMHQNIYLALHFSITI